MSKTKRERIILGLLVTVLLFALWRVWGSFGGSGSVPDSGARISAVSGSSPGVDTDSFDAVEISSNWADTISGGGNGDARDPFRYAPVPTPRAAPPPAPPEPPRETFRQPPPQRPVEPPPAPLPLRYVGYGRSGGSGADPKAILMDNDGVPYPAAAGDTVLGRYRVQEFDQEFAVVEDLQSGRRERLPVELND